jgi:hypothetical protein
MAEFSQSSDSLSGSALPLAPLATQMKVDFLVNDRGRIAVLHDRRLAAVPQWVEYDEDAGQLLIVYDDGRIQELGMIIPAAAREPILSAGEAAIVQIEPNVRHPMLTVPVIVRQAMFH